MAAASGAAHVPLPCTQCGTGRAKCCTGCRLAFFCGRECQRAAWPVHAAQCNSRKLGPLSPAPKAALVDAGAQGAGLRATASIAAGEEVLCEPPLLLTSAERSAAIRQRLGGGELSQSRTAEAYVLHILSGVHALYDAPDHTRRAVMTELCQPVRDLKAAMESRTPEPEPEPEPEACANDAGVERGDVVLQTVRNAARWRDLAWLSWSGSDLAAQNSLPPWLSLAEFTRFLLIFQSNAWSLSAAAPGVASADADAEASGGSALLRLGSKFNHSCSPCVAFSWDDAEGLKPKSLFFALRDIAPDEDLTVSYLSDSVLELGVEERRWRLRQKPGMEAVTCCCARCLAEEEVAAAAAAADD